MNWGQVNSVTKLQLTDILEKYGEVFNEEFGRMKNYAATIDILGDAKPHLHKAHTVPLCIQVQGWERIRTTG